MAMALDIAARLEASETIRPEAPRPLFREMPEPSPFPAAALGPVLSAAAESIAAVIQCPVECAANTVLAVASLAAQGQYNVILPVGQGKPAPLSLYVMTVLESGERKSSADAMALVPVREFQRELAQAGAAERQAYAVQQTAFDTTFRVLNSRHKKDRAALEAALHDLGPPPQPPLNSVIAPGGDQTMEGLFRIFQNGRPSLAMLCDDGASFLGGHSLRIEQRASTTANLCRAWDGSRLERIRGGDGAIILYDRRLACHLMVQPGVASEFLSDGRFADQGLLARFLVSAPTGTAGTRFRNDTQDRIIAAEAAHDLAPYNRIIGKLLALPIRWKNDDDRTLGVEMGQLELSDEARALYSEFVNVIERQLGSSGRFRAVMAFANKLPEQAVRIAGILTVIAGGAQVEAETLGQAMKLGEYYLSEAMRLRAAGWVDPELRVADDLRLWLLDRPDDVIALREIYRSGPSPIRSQAKARAAMDLLAEHGWVHFMQEGAEIDGTRHKAAWRIIRA